MAMWRSGPANGLRWYHWLIAYALASLSPLLLGLIIMFVVIVMGRSFDALGLDFLSASNDPFPAGGLPPAISEPPVIAPPEDIDRLGIVTMADVFPPRDASLSGMLTLFSVSLVSFVLLLYGAQGTWIALLPLMPFVWLIVKFRKGGWAPFLLLGSIWGATPLLLAWLILGEWTPVSPWTISDWHALNMLEAALLLYLMLFPLLVGALVAVVMRETLRRFRPAVFIS